MGHSTTIVSASYSHVRKKQPFFSRLWKKDSIDGISYIWLKTPRYHGNGVRRAINIFVFVALATIHAKIIAKEVMPDAVIASSTYPLDNYVANYIARRSKAKHIYEVHDIWPLSPIELGGMSDLHPFIVLMKWAERYAYRRADEVVSLLPNAYEHMAEQGLAIDKFFYMPNGVNFGDWENQLAELPSEVQSSLTEAKQKGQLIVGYAGAHGLANCLMSLIEAANMLKDEKILFVLVGQGPEKERLIETSRQLGLRNVLFFSPVDRIAIPRLLDQFDIAYIGLRSTPVFRFGISPNKLMDYMMSAKPVVLAIDTEKDMITASGGGIKVNPEDGEAIASAIRKIGMMSRSEREEMGRRGKRYIEEHHDYRIIGKKFLEVLANRRPGQK